MFLLCLNVEVCIGCWYYICFALCVQFGGQVFSLGKGTARKKRIACFMEHPEKVEKSSHKYAILKYFWYVSWGIAIELVLLCEQPIKVFLLIKENVSLIMNQLRFFAF